MFDDRHVSTAYLLMKRLSEVSAQGTVELYAQLQTVDDGLAGTVYTSLVHLYFSQDTSMTLRSLDSSVIGETHELKKTGSAEFCHLSNLANTQVFKEQYYGPMSPVTSTFDAFYISADRHVYLFNDASGHVRCL